VDAGSFVIAHLINPKEHFWGLLKELNAAGLTLRGISMNSFEDWARQVAKGEEKTMDVVLMFFPMHRVERIFLDEDMGVLPSLTRQFYGITRMNAREYMESSFDETPSSH
jgi:hypothetical protein